MMSLAIVTRVLFGDISPNLKLYVDEGTIDVLRKIYGENLPGNLAFHFKKYFLDGYLNNTEDDNGNFVYVALLTNNKSLRGLTAEDESSVRFILQPVCLEKRTLNGKDNYTYHLLQPLIEDCDLRNSSNYSGELAELLNEAMKPVAESEIEILRKGLNHWFGERLVCFRN